MTFQTGQRASLSRSFNIEEVKAFSALSMDANPVHYDEAYAAATRFGKCIVQGPMVASLIGGVLGSELPGRGTIYIQQSTRFLKPVFIDEMITANVEVTNVRSDKPVVTLRTWVEKENGEVVVEGEAVVLFLEKL